MPTLRTIITTSAAGIAAPVIGEWFVKLAEEHGIYDAPSSHVARLMSWFISLAAIPGYQFLAGCMVGLAGGLWIERFIRSRKLTPANSQPGTSLIKTMIRLDRDRSAPFQWKEAAKSNIFTWFQIWNHKPSVIITPLGEDFRPMLNINIPERFPAVAENEKTRPEQLDTFYFTFDMPIAYRDIQINSFGHEFPPHEWYNCTERTAILLVREPLSPAMTTFEIHFIPPIQS